MFSKAEIYFERLCHKPIRKINKHEAHSNGRIVAEFRNKKYTESSPFFYDYIYIIKWLTICDVAMMLYLIA